MAGSGDPDRIATLVGYEAPGAKAVLAADAAQADLVVLAIPLGKFRSLPADALAGALVVDAMNYWWEYDGAIPELSDPLTSTSETLQEFLRDSRVVKTLNHMSVYALEHEARPAGDPDRKALAIAGGRADAGGHAEAGGGTGNGTGTTSGASGAGDASVADVARVAEFVERIGFDAVLAGPLAEGMRLEPHTALFAADEDAAEVRAILDRYWESQRGRVVARARGLA